MKAIERTGIDYYCQVSDVELIKKYIQEIECENPVCINIGAGMGTSALAMLEARKDSHVFSIDIEKCPIEQEAIKEMGYENLVRYTFIEGRSQDVGKWFEKAWADFIFVDGGHTYEECCQDAEVWFKVLKPGGILAFHDYHSKIKVLESVTRAVDDVSKKLALELIIHKGTLIMFRKVWDWNEDMAYSGCF